MIYPIESFANVDGYNSGPGWGFRVIKPICNSSGDGKKGRGTGTEGNEPMLFTSRSKRSSEIREDKSFQNFDGRGEKRNGVVGGAKVRGFSWCEDRDNVRCLPDRGEVSLTNRMVKKSNEIRDAPRP
jgi:hypothetical protein